MVQELRACVVVWKGTGEEKARGKFVDELEDIVEEERRKRGESNPIKENPKPSLGRSGSAPPASLNRGIPAPLSRSTDTTSGPGFLRNLQRLRDEIYME